MNRFNPKEQKIIDQFKRYIEIEYMDYINEETISIYCELFQITEEGKEVLRRRFIR